MRIDAHQHLWDVRQSFRAVGDSWFLGALHYPWRELSLPSLDRSFLPPQLRAELGRSRFDGSILVNVLHSADETHWMLATAKANPYIRGVVGWVDLTRPPDELEAEVTMLQELGPLVGIRHLAQFEPDPGWLVRPAVLAGLQVLEHLALPFDLLVTERELPCVPRIAEALPDLSLVLDHAGKPPLRTGQLGDWERHLRVAAQNPRLSCKLSGLVTEADLRAWRVEDLRPAIAVAIEAFGPGRLMVGSDWPVCTLAASYKQAIAATRSNLESLLGSDLLDHEDQIFGGLAQNVYRLRIA